MGPLWGGGGVSWGRFVGCDYIMYWGDWSFAGWRVLDGLSR